MANSIFNTFRNEEQYKEKEFSIERFVETIIDELLTSNLYREEIFKTNKADNAENTLKAMVINLLSQKTGVQFSSDEVIKLVLDYFFQYYLVQPLLDDEKVSDIRINAPDDIWYKREGKSYKADIKFPSVESLEVFVRSVVIKNGGVINNQKPTFIGGDINKMIRISAKIPPATIKYPFIHFRIHRLLHTSLVELREYYQMMSPEILNLIAKSIFAKARIAVVGPSGSGKSTLMRAIINGIPGNRPSITIEQVPELYVGKPNNTPVAIVSRTISGMLDSSIRLSDYTYSALVEGVECICIGEIKGEEAFDIIDAYGTGHDGVNTFHVDDPKESHIRFLHMASGNVRARNFSDSKLIEMFARAFDLIIYMNGFKVAEVCEIDYIDNRVVYNTLYEFVPTALGERMEGYYVQRNPVKKLKHKFELTRHLHELSSSEGST